MRIIYLILSTYLIFFPLLQADFQQTQYTFLSSQEMFDRLLQDSEAWNSDIMAEHGASELSWRDCITNINYGKTKLAKHGLHKLLQPTNSIKTIHKRQKHIKKLIDCPELLASLTASLENIETYLDACLTYWQEESVLSNQQTHMLKYNLMTYLWPQINQSSFAQDFQLILQPILPALMAHAFDWGGSMFIDHLRENTNNSLIKALSMGKTAMTLAQYWSIASHNYQKFIPIHKIQRTISHIAHTIAEAEHIQDVCRTFMSSYSKNINFTQALQSNLRESFHTSTFNKDAYIYSPGKVMATHEMLCQQKNDLTTLLEYISDVDALVSCARFYLQHQTSDNQVCFARIDPRKSRPYLNIEGFWTPMISAEKAVSSSITADERNIIISGPNGIGKSTALKGITHGIMLAQSVGIMPAQQADISLFDHINTYLNIKENIEEGLSSFMAEKKRIDEISEEIMHLSGVGLYLIDEPFRGTYAQEAEKRTCRFGEFVDEHPHVSVLLATHFEKPTHLSDEYRFDNYHINMYENSDFTFTLTYRMDPGVLTWWFYDEEKRERFIDWITWWITQEA